MGANESISPEIKGHPDVFYKGIQAAKEGRYQTAEFYFHQALRKHDGREFWVDIINRYYGNVAKLEKKKRSDDISLDAGELNSKNVSNLESVDGQDGGSCGTREVPTVSATQSNLNEIKLIDLPLDESVIGILDYLRLMADIMNAYLCHEMDDKNLNLAFVHCCYFGLHVQIMYYLLSVWDADNAELLKKLEEGTLFEIDESLNEKKKNGKGKSWSNAINSETQSEGSTSKGAGMNGGGNVLVSGKKFYPTESNRSSDVNENSANGLTDDDGVSGGNHSLWKKVKTLKMASKDEMPSSTDILMARKSIFAFTRHHWMAVVFNYCILALLYVEKRCLPTEVRKINGIFQNVLFAASSSIWDLRQILEAEAPKNALAANLLSQMPENKGFTFDAEALKNGGVTDDISGEASRGESKVSSNFFASLTGNVSCATRTRRGGSVNSAMQTFLSISSLFSPIYPLLMDPTKNLPMRFNLRVDTPKSKLCTHKLRPPGSYNLFQYLNWIGVQDVFMVAGYNSYYLNKMLPYYNTLAKGGESSFLSKLKVKTNTSEQGVGTTFVKKVKGTNVQLLSSVERQNYLDPAERELMKNDLDKNERTVGKIKGQKSYYNPLLKENDLHTFNAVVFEEDFTHAVYPILFQSKVFLSTGNVDEGQKWLSFILYSMEELYGKESDEYIYMTRVVEACKI